MARRRIGSAMSAARVPANWMGGRIVVTRCNHQFHANCLSMVVNKDGVLARCPLCRTCLVEAPENPDSAYGEFEFVGEEGGAFGRIHVTWVSVTWGFALPYLCYHLTTHVVMLLWRHCYLVASLVTVLVVGSRLVRKERVDHSF